MELGRGFLRPDFFMKTLQISLFLSLLCGCYGNTQPGQYKTKERPSAFIEKTEDPKSKDASKAKEAKDTKAEKSEPKSAEKKK